jgi:hypothetical protein
MVRFNQRDLPSISTNKVLGMSFFVFAWTLIFLGYVCNNLPLAFQVDTDSFPRSLSHLSGSPKHISTGYTSDSNASPLFSGCRPLLSLLKKQQLGTLLEISLRSGQRETRLLAPPREQLQWAPSIGLCLCLP